MMMTTAVNREDSEPSGSREETKLASRSENYSKSSEGALDVDLSRSLHFILVVDLLGHLLQGGQKPGLLYKAEAFHIHVQEMEVILHLL